MNKEIKVLIKIPRIGKNFPFLRKILQNIVKLGNAVAAQLALASEKKPCITIMIYTGKANQPIQWWVSESFQKPQADTIDMKKKIGPKTNNWLDKKINEPKKEKFGELVTALSDKWLIVENSLEKFHNKFGLQTIKKPNI